MLQPFPQAVAFCWGVLVWIMGPRLSGLVKDVIWRKSLTTNQCVSRIKEKLWFQLVGYRENTHGTATDCRPQATVFKILAITSKSTVPCHTSTTRNMKVWVLLGPIMTGKELGNGAPCLAAPWYDQLRLHRRPCWTRTCLHRCQHTKTSKRSKCSPTAPNQYLFYVFCNMLAQLEWHCAPF